MVESDAEALLAPVCVGWAWLFAHDVLPDMPHDVPHAKNTAQIRMQAMKMMRGQ